MPFKSKIPDITIPDDISVPEFIVEHFNQHPNRKLLIDPYTKREFTCQQVSDLIKKVSAGFYKLGLKTGELVALALPNMVEYPFIALGIQNLGAIPTVFNPAQTLEELTHQLQDSSAKYLVTVPQLLEKVKEIMKQVQGQVKEVIVVGKAPGTISFADLINNNGEFPRHKFDTRTTVALVPYSSGTTGLPKGVELTHYNIVANVLQTLALLGSMNSGHETWISFLPFFHIYGNVTILYTAMRSLHTLVVMPRFDKLHYLKFIQEYKPTILPIVPPIVLLLSQDPVVSQYDTSSVKYFLCAAAPLSAELEVEFKKRFKNVPILQGYGMTELSPFSHAQHVSTKVPGSVGRLCPNMTMKIVDENGTELGIGQTGEVWLRGPNVMKAYRNNPKATTDMIDRDGYLHTGDVAYVDADENLFIVDRIKELIKYKGFQVAPAELEALLLTHPDVEDVAVVGKPSVEAGEVPAAFVVRKKESKLSAKDLVAWADQKTSHYKQLRGGVVFVETIPKSAAGKILRKLLRSKL
eukprot:Phypoly_transcript_02359.p1 GENE.Phypoly_transcript_02359~~Phypoly_transcript_02359.p1  ORF type:complete len:523 (-),score=74.68 Phypoly_transcript_02359:105-1673(-)